LSIFDKKIFMIALPCIFMLAVLTKPVLSEEIKYELFELIELGIDQSLLLETDRLQHQNVYSALLSSYYDFLPSATVSASRNLINDDIETAGFSLSKSISLNEPTYFNWRRARIDWENAQYELEENRKKTAFEIFRLYMMVLESRRRIEIQKSNLDIQKKIFNQIELLYEQQQRSLLDLKQSEIALINAEISYENAQIQHRQARENLFLYLNIEDNGYPLIEPDLALQEEEFEYQAPLELIKTENNLNRTKLSLRQTKLDFLPSLALSYHYNYRYPGPQNAENIWDFREYKDSYTVSLTASYSLLNPVEQRQVYYRSKRSFRAQELQYNYQTANLEKTFMQLTRAWDNEKRVFSLVEKRYELAGDNLQMAQERFNLGIMSLLELDQAVSDYLEAEIDYSTRYYQLLIKQEEINLFLSRRILDRW